MLREEIEAELSALLCLDENEDLDPTMTLDEYGVFWCDLDFNDGFLLAFGVHPVQVADTRGCVWAMTVEEIIQKLLVVARVY